MQSTLSWIAAYLRVFSLALLFGASLFTAMLITSIDGAADYYKLAPDSLQPLNGTILLSWGLASVPAAFLLAAGELTSLFLNRHRMPKALLKLLPGLLCLLLAVFYAAILTPQIQQCLAIWQDIQVAKAGFISSLPSFLQPGGSGLREIQLKAETSLEHLKRFKLKAPQLPGAPKLPHLKNLELPRPSLPGSGPELRSGNRPGFPLPGPGPGPTFPGPPLPGQELPTPGLPEVHPANLPAPHPPILPAPKPASLPEAPALPHFGTPFLPTDHKELLNTIKTLESLKEGPQARNFQDLISRATQLQKDLKQLHDNSQILLTLMIGSSFMALLVLGAEVRAGAAVEHDA